MLTVILPCYNPPAGVFSETLKALAGSTSPNLKLIAVVDGGTDVEVLPALASQFPQALVVRHLENRGLSAARNTGVAACTTPFFLQHDADDQIEPTFIEKALWALESHPEWAFCNAWHIAFGGRNYEWKRGFERGPEFLRANGTMPLCVIRREVDRVIGGHDESIRSGCEDWDYWLKMAAHGYWGGTIPEFLVRYRIHAPPNWWPTRDDPARLGQFRREMRRRYPQLWRGGWPKLKAPPPGRPKVDIPEAFQPLPRRERNRKHILLVVPWMTWGGADQFNLLLMERLIERGYTFTICATLASPNPWLEKFKRYTDDIFILPNFLRPEDYPRFLHYLIEARAAGIVCVTGSMLGYGLLPYLRSRCPDVVCVDYIHMVDETWGDGGYARAGLNQRQWLDLSIVTSRQIKQWMVSRGAEPARVQECYINVDTDQWNPARYDRSALQRALKIPPDTVVILYAARLTRQKRPGMLVEALARLRHGKQRFVCLVAGDGRERRRLERQIAWRGLRNHVRLLGAVEPNRMPELMAASDLFFLPSQDEGIALTLYEAMAMGLAVVAAQVGGQRELVTPEAGVLIPHGPNEGRQYAQSLARLIESASLRAALGQKARERVAAYFNADQMTERMIGLLEAAADRQRVEPPASASLEEGYAHAARVVEAAQRVALSERLFGSHPAEGRLGQPKQPHSLDQYLLRGLRRWVLGPLYRWGVEHGLAWLVPLKHRLYRFIGQWPR